GRRLDGYRDERRDAHVLACEGIVRRRLAGGLDAARRWRGQQVGLWSRDLRARHREGRSRRAGRGEADDRSAQSAVAEKSIAAQMIFRLKAEAHQVELKHSCGFRLPPSARSASAFAEGFGGRAVALRGGGSADRRSLGGGWSGGRNPDALCQRNESRMLP